MDNKFVVIKSDDDFPLFYTEYENIERYSGNSGTDIQVGDYVGSYRVFARHIRYYRTLFCVDVMTIRYTDGIYACIRRPFSENMVFFINENMDASLVHPPDPFNSDMNWGYNGAGPENLNHAVAAHAARGYVDDPTDKEWLRDADKKLVPLTHEKYFLGSSREDRTWQEKDFCFGKNVVLDLLDIKKARIVNVKRGLEARQKGK